MPIMTMIEAIVGGIQSIHRYPGEETAGASYTETALMDLVGVVPTGSARIEQYFGNVAARSRYRTRKW
jgi:hypothetical protein